jgi:hypothetical protein
MRRQRFERYDFTHDLAPDAMISCRTQEVKGAARILGYNDVQQAIVRLDTY